MAKWENIFSTFSLYIQTFDVCKGCGMLNWCSQVTILYKFVSASVEKKDLEVS